MTKIDIFSGFLGAGKTTLIKKLIKESLNGIKLVLIENEFGEIGIDSGFLKESGIQITEMNSGCICCSLVGDFGEALSKVITTYQPDRILIEPSGVGKLSDVIKAVQKIADSNDIIINSCVAVVDAVKCKMYIKNFGEFFINQIESAETIIMSRTQNLSKDKIQQCLDLIREHNNRAVVITTPWEELTGDIIMEAIERENSLLEELQREAIPIEDEEEHHHHEHHHHDDDEDDDDEDDDDDDDEDDNDDEDNDDDSSTGEHHEHHHHEHHHHKHHHDEDDEEECHDENCNHEQHHHSHEGHHHAEDIFMSWGKETPKCYAEVDLKNILDQLSDVERFGIVLRAKGIVEDDRGTWLHFDYVPGESEIRAGAADYTGRLCVIGSELKTDKLEELF